MSIIKPLIDTNEYKHVILDNKLSVLLIYDKNTDVSAAAMNVNVGFYNDPIKSQGIAHFLEHMLFMGTTKWPKENYYNEFINKSGGTTNAHTLEESTTYYFEVLNKYFFDSINIFSNFFVDPLLSENAIEREINAINSEYMKNAPIDIVKVLSVLKDVMDNKDHPYYNFGFGNTKTLLKDDIRNVLKNFYDTYYSANIMNLVVLSNSSIEIMEKKITTMFLKIPNKNIEIPCQIPKNYFPFNQQKSLQIVPVENVDSLYIFFQVPNVDEYYKYKPLQYILYLLSHKSKGSIFDVLKKNEYATKVKSRVYESDTSFNLIGVCVRLTKKGIDNYDHVIDCIKTYIDLIKNSEFNDFVLDEIKILNKIGFDYSVIDEKISYVSGLSMNMLKYKTNDIIYGDYVIELENKNKIKNIVNSCLKYIDMSKSIIIVSSKKFESSDNLKEKWFNTEYNYIKLNNNLLSDHIKNDLKLPIRNDFIPHDLKLFDNPLNKDKFPIKHEDNVWYKFDNFGVPKVFVDVILYTNKVTESPTNYLLFDMYLTLFAEHNYDKLYYARMCETGYSIIYDINFIGITFFGFNNNIHRIIELFVNSFFTFIEHVSPNVFEFTKNGYMIDLENNIYEPLYVLSSNRMNNSIYLKDYSNSDLLNVIKNIQFEDIKNPSSWLHKNCNLKMLIYGNINKDMLEYIKYFDVFYNKNNLITNDNKVIGLHDGESQIYIMKSQNINDNNYLINVFYEIGHIVKKISGDWEINMLCTFFIHAFVKEKFFTQIRTKEQSGYIVKAFIKSFLHEKGSIYGISFLVQSPHINPSVLRKRIKKFVASTYSSLLRLQNPKNISKFELYKNNIKLGLEQKLVSQYEEHDFIFNEILSNEFAFDYKTILIDNIDSLNINTLIKFYETYFINKNTRKVRICEIYKKTK